MVDVPAEAALCVGSGIPSAVVDDLTLDRRTYMCEWCGAAMMHPIASDHLVPRP